MRTILLTVFILYLSTIVSFAQSFGEWKTYTSVRTVNDLTIDAQGNIWAATTGGVFSTNLAGESSKYTTKEGVWRMDGTAIAYNNSKKQIFVGYVDGVLDVIDVDENEIFALSDIKRSQNFTSKRINDLLINNEQLFVATDFGIVVYNLENLFVEDSFIQFGSFTRAIAVTDLYIENGIIYAVTPEGIAVGNLSNELSINSNWDLITSDNSPISEQVTAIGAHEQIIYVSTMGGNFVRSENNWNSFNGFGDEIIVEFFEEGDQFGAHSDRTIYTYNSDSDSFNSIKPSGLNLQSVKYKSGEIYVGTASDGVGIVDENTGGVNLIEIAGPYQNYFSGLNVDGNVLIAASTNESAGNSAIDNAKGYYIYDGESWQNYNQRTNQVIDDFGYQQSFTSTITPDYYYFGSWGRGVARHNIEEGSVIIFDETNSTLRGWEDDNDQFPVISGLQTDSNDDVWLVSRYGNTPLYYQSPGDEDWTPLPKANAASVSDEYFGLFIDSFDQKWITLENTSTAGNGLLVVNTGTDPNNSADDASVKLTAGPNSGNLPDDKVNAIIQDKEGEVWIGTGRGIARFIFPELIIDGGVQEREAQWLINEDTTAASRFLLRDINVSTMAVNAANEKWIGSVNQGIWVLNAEGSRIIDRFTTENSPLYSNNIISIAINDITGEVFIATDVGLISYQGISKAPVQEMNTLKVFPNPFSYTENSGIVIEGLSEETTLKIVGVDGSVVQEIEARGGSIKWDGLGYNGNELGTGVYFIIAYEDDSRQTGMGKVVIVR